MNTITQMTDAALAKAARDHDRIQNEGGVGYNPYRNEIANRAAAAERARPKSRREQIASLQRQIATLDCSVARESGTYDQAEIDDLQAQIATLTAKDDAEFMAVWTKEVWESRRAAWNDAMRALPGFASGKVRSTDVSDIAKRMGVTEADMLRAKAIYSKQGA